MAAVDGSDVEIVFVTRFNLNLTFKKQKRSVHLDRSWLTDRISLLETYCAPKINNQTDSRFRWIILIDPETPADLKQAIGDVSGAELLAASSLAEARAALSSAVSDFDKLLVTVRVDSDDQVSCFFTEKIRKEAAIAAGLADDKIALYFANGMNYDTANSQFYHGFHPLNPFPSLLERAAGGGSIATVLVRSHLSMAEKFPTHIVQNHDPMWCCVVHGGNVKNVISGKTIETPHPDW